MESPLTIHEVAWWSEYVPLAITSEKDTLTEEEKTRFVKVMQDEGTQRLMAVLEAQGEHLDKPSLSRLVGRFRLERNLTRDEANRLPVAEVAEWAAAEAGAIPDAPGQQRLPLETEPERAEDASATHSPDFACVNWYGEIYEFTKSQAACVKVLWEARDNKAPTVGQETILELAEVNQTELRKVFAGHPAWGTMIFSPSKGRYRLNKNPSGGKTDG